MNLRVSQDGSSLLISIGDNFIIVTTEVIAKPLSKSFFFLFFKRFYLFIFRERGREEERDASHVLPTGDLACNPGMWPTWESNQQPFGSQAHTQTTELPQPGLFFLIFVPMTFHFLVVESTTAFV